MRIAAIYDIHGNLPALEAVYSEIAAAAVDAIVVGGDVVAGPRPPETLDFLLALKTPIYCIKGNADREVIAQAMGQTLGAVPDHVVPIIKWVAAQLRPEQIVQMATWPLTLSLEVDGLGRLLFCHATPHNDTDVFTRLTPEAALRPIFATVDASLVVCGHTHMQFDRHIGPTRVANAGSVGMPYGERGAYWLLLGPDVAFQRTEYNFEAAAASILHSGYPQAEAFAAENVLAPPSEARALALFTHMTFK